MKTTGNQTLMQCHDPVIFKLTINQLLIIRWGIKTHTILGTTIYNHM